MCHLPCILVLRQLTEGYVLRDRAQASQESDVCPGCLIQRFQKYSVREAATTQPPPLAITAGCSSPATSFTQFPPSQLSSGSAYFCVQRAFMPHNHHISIPGRGVHLHISPIILERVDRKGIYANYPREINSFVVTKTILLLYINYNMACGIFDFALKN